MAMAIGQSERVPRVGQRRNAFGAVLADRSKNLRQETLAADATDDFPLRDALSPLDGAHEVVALKSP
jgi:hypothetical protein